MPSVAGKVQTTINRGLFGGDIVLSARKKTRQIPDKSLTHWAVIELGKDSRIWGIGKDQSAAIMDAVVALIYHSDLSIDIDEGLKLLAQGGGLKATRCTRKLFKEVETYGGEIEFVMVPGAGAFLPTEHQGGNHAS